MRCLGRGGGDGSYGLYLGTLLPFKGVETLIRALAIAPPHPFHVLGAGEMRSQLEQLVTELGLEKHIRFCGFLEEALEREIVGARYAVVPSECYENFPYAAIELMARGIPLIASAIGGIPELAHDGETGLLFPPGDPAALAKISPACGAIRRFAPGWGERQPVHPGDMRFQTVFPKPDGSL